MMTIRILEILYGNMGQSVSGEHMAEILGISRTAVKKHIDKLINSGYNISAVKKSGYSLDYFDDNFDRFSLGMFFKKYGIDMDIVFYDETDSTSTQAKKQFFNSSEGIVAAARQTGGRGRRGRSFISENGGLYVSYYTKPRGISPFDAVKAVISAAAAVKNTLDFYNADCGIKWANDIFIGGKKVCGILCEMLCESERTDFLLQGIGININNDFEGSPLKDIAISLKQATGKKFMRAEICARLIKELKKCNDMLFDGKFADILNIYKKNCITLHKEVYISAERSFKAYAEDIDENGFLLVRTPEGLKRIVYGDVSVKV